MKSNKQSTFKVNLALCHAAGILLLLGIAFLPVSDARFLPPLRAVAILAASAAMGFGLRVLRRKIFFGSGISLHRSFSYEAIVQTVQLISPFFPRRAFEAEFLEGEGHIVSTKVLSWLSLRAVSSLSLAIFSIAVLMKIFLGGLHFAAALVVALIFVLISRDSWKEAPLRFTMMLVGGSFIWIAEGVLFCLAAKACSIETDKAVALYILFTGLYELSPSPFALGVAELPVLFLGGESFAPIFAFHCMRALPTFIFGWLYLSRYKFSVSDFFNPGLVDVLARRKSLEVGRATAKIAKIAIVIPAFNEEKRISPFLHSVLEYANTNKLVTQVVIVDDGSSDRTAGIVSEFSAKNECVRLISNGNNRGKGFSVRRGVLAAEADAILYADADGATPITEMEPLLDALNSSAEIAIGSRRSAKAERTGFRYAIGGVFYRVVNLLAVPGIDDSQCGFKMFTREAAGKIFARSLEDGWAFDVEILYVAQLLGYRIAQIPVRWTEQEGSKVSVLRDSLKMLVAVFRIRSRHGGLMKDA